MSVRWLVASNRIVSDDKGIKCREKRAMGLGEGCERTRETEATALVSHRDVSHCLAPRIIVLANARHVHDTLANA